jgi:hypothetical protein
MVFFYGVTKTLTGRPCKANYRKHQSVIKTKKDESTPRKYFMICQTCFWCASYIDIMDNIGALPYMCPTCNHTAIELLPLSNGERYRFESSGTRGITLEFK